MIATLLALFKFLSGMGGAEAPADVDTLDGDWIAAQTDGVFLALDTDGAWSALQTDGVLVAAAGVEGEWIAPGTLDGAWTGGPGWPPL